MYLTYYSNFIKQLTGISLTDDIPIGDIETFVDIHNLVGILLLQTERIKKTFPEKNIIGRLRNKQISIEKHVNNNINSIQELYNNLPKNTEYIIFKGISAYILTGCKGILKKGDIDILSNNPGALIETLIKLGYKQTKEPFLNELGEYTKNRSEFDVQSYFPVYSYPKILLKSELQPYKNIGKWLQNYCVKQKNILFEDLYRHYYISKNRFMLKSKVADVNMLMVIICAHAFLNYINIWSISYRENVCIKIGEMLTLFKLAKHKLFNYNVFSQIVELFEAQDAIKWVGNVCKALFGRSPFPICDSNTLKTKDFLNGFPRCLWWNFWVDVPVFPAELLQKQKISAIKIINSMNTQQMKLVKNTTKKYSTFRFENVTLFDTFICQSEKVLDCCLEIKLFDDELCFCVEIKPPSDIKKIHFRIDLGYAASEIMYKVNEQKTLVVGLAVNVVIKGNFQFLLSYSGQAFKIIKSNLYGKNGISLFFGVSEFKSNDIYSPTNSILIPINVLI